MKRVHIAIFVVALLVCLVEMRLRTPSSTYDAESIELLATGFIIDGYEVQFATPNDPGFSCPGVVATFKNDAYIFSFLRSPTDKESSVDLPAYVSYSGNTAVCIPYPDNWRQNGWSVVIFDDDGGTISKAFKHRPETGG